MQQLPFGTIEKYLSDYLLKGWKEEALTLQRVEVDDGHVAGYIDVDHFPQPGDGVFHLSAQTALVWIAQIGIIYGCWENDLPRKMGEVFMRDLSLRFHRPVHRQSGIRIAGRFDARGRRVLPDRSVFYKGVQVDVDGGAFTGTASFIVPTLPHIAPIPAEANRPLQHALSP